MTLRMPVAVRDEVVVHAREGAPEEVVGAFGGERGDPAVVETVHRAENVADRPRVRYEMDPEEQFSLLRGIEGSGREVVGFYHSHPRGPLEPSATDADRAAWPDRSYVIVSLAGDAELGSWRWTGERFEREPVLVD
jgi:proteasome lid subunit RPN8/RPN11